MDRHEHHGLFCRIATSKDFSIEDVPFPSSARLPGRPDPDPILDNLSRDRQRYADYYHCIWLWYGKRVERTISFESHRTVRSRMVFLNS